MEGENKPTARFLQARLQALSDNLKKRLEIIFAAAAHTTAEPPSHTTSFNNTARPATYVDTATEQLQIEVESTALIKAAEEIMVLTRGMKDLWLFGGLDTLQDGQTGEKEGDKKMGEDIMVVREALLGYLERRGEGNEKVERDQKEIAEEDDVNFTL